jgi:hypothetical protein
MTPMKLRNGSLPLITNARWLVVALLDFDSFAAYRAFPERARFAAHTFGVPFRCCRLARRRTSRGWHVVVHVYTRREISPLFMVALQSILGSDSRRETFNLFRAVRLKQAPRAWQDTGRWNTLYRRKFEPLTQEDFAL